ncbi:hypothetical protein [uncultured Desulfobacter sp.]|uniref:hypothetical protein n=1 Tax=uncultured Desulfobacter sp. TaxID=240139 RepID=UPI002AAAD13A|nr:hypothetical protein [uncultured Desulfobacter sp.]
MAGPAAESAFKMLAENTETYLGKDFSDDTALGAVTSALFDEIKTTSQGGSIADTFSKQGVIRLYQAGLGLAVKQPELFAGSDESTKSKLFAKLLSGAAELFRKYPQLKEPVCAELTAMVIEAVGETAPALMKLNPDNLWENTVKNVLAPMTAGLAAALENKEENDSLKGALVFFKKTQLTELGRIVLKQAALTPGMMGSKVPEIEFIISGIAEAMAADDNLLLSADQWLQIAGVAVQKAAANPGRLFNLSKEDNEKSALAVDLLSSILRVAGETWTSGGRVEGILLFGETLKLALKEALNALAGNVDAVLKKPELMEAFINQVLAAAKAHPEKMGSQGVLTVFKAFIGTVLGKGDLPGQEKIIDSLSA